MIGVVPELYKQVSNSLLVKSSVDLIVRNSPDFPYGISLVCGPPPGLEKLEIEMRADHRWGGGSQHWLDYRRNGGSPIAEPRGVRVSIDLIVAIFE